MNISRFSAPFEVSYQYLFFLLRMYLYNTRNQFASNRTWVRIPSSPPKKSSKLKGLLDFPFLSDSLNFPIFALERR